MYWLPAALLLVAFASGAHAQATAQTSVAPDLRECYTDRFLLDRNNLPPANINILIDIIRRIEDDPNVNVDLRTLATLLLHTYRQDGIQYHQRDANLPLSANVLPFSPTFHSFHRHRLLLRIIPSNLQTLPNNTISSQLKCALHHMLSTTVDARLRGDENNCGQLSQYRALRTYRRARRSVDDDVEILDLSKLGADKNGQMQLDPDNDVEYTEDLGARSARQLVGGSSCPILTGVVNTRWGAVSAGNLIAGIAAGAEAQQVPILELTKGSVLNYQNVQSTITTIYPATLAGDLAEAVLIQGTRGSSSITIGRAGNWNSSQATRFYMLSNSVNLEMSDPEIRGGIDGFVLGSTLTQTLGSSSSLRLSQLLDMYYAPRNGVFNNNLRACNRRQLNQASISSTVLAGETRAFAAVLDSVMPLEGTLTGGLEGLVDSSINNFQSYMTSNMNDLNCANTENTLLSPDSRYKTNLYIALDASWSYNMIYPAISFLLDSVEVNKFGSSVTLLSAFDGSVILNQTDSLSGFHSQYTLSRHNTFMTGVNLEVSLTNIRTMMQAQLMNESSSNYVGGNATALVFLLNSGAITNNANVAEQARLLRELVPDLRLFFATAANQFDNLSNLVLDPRNDIVTITLNAAGTNVEETMFPLLSRIQMVGRRIINPMCGAEFVAQSSGTRQFDDNVEPGYINFYRVSPNYFFGNNENARIRIARTGAAVGTLNICHSRSVVLPRPNATIGADPSEVTCQNLAASGNVEINLSEACSGFSTISECPPLHISVQAVTTATTTTATCTNNNLCRFPYNVMYQVQIQDLSCFSSATSIVSSVVFVVIGLLLNFHRSL